MDDDFLFLFLHHSAEFVFPFCLAFLLVVVVVINML